MLSELEQKIRRVLLVFTWGACGVLACLILLVTADVIARKSVGSIPGSYELVEFLMVPVVFLTLAFVQASREHIRVTLVLESLAKTGHHRVESAIELINLVVGFIIWGLVGWFGAIRTVETFKVGEYAMGTVNFPYWPAYAFIPVGCLLFCCQFILDIIREIKDYSGNHV